MSAPPMPMIRCQPMNPEIIKTAIMVHIPDPLVYHIPSRIHASRAIAFKACPPGNLKGLPSNFPANFPNATIDPVNVTAPMKTPRNTSTFKIAISTASFAASFLPKPVKSLKSLSDCINCRTVASSNSAFNPINTAANPTKLCNAATS